MALFVENQTISNVCKRAQLCNPEKIADSLQGSIWRASTISDSSANAPTVVMKVTNEEQHNNSISICNNKVYCNVKENILLEQSILKYVTQHPKCPPSIVKFVTFFKTSRDLCLIMEDGGGSLFDFVTSVHELIQSHHIEISHWRKVVKVIFRQMVESIQFIHDHNVCHHDISLENFVINDVAICVDETGKIRFTVEDIRVKLCDFGLAELYTNPQCVSSKHCGKTQYKSPEVMNKKRHFDAKKNDVWCGGVCLFMLLFGCAPWRAACSEDQAFTNIMDGHIMDLLVQWGLLMYIDVYSIDLLRSVFKCEEDRINVKQMEQHCFLRH